jgi:PAS domain S-box-containing protein
MPDTHDLPTITSLLRQIAAGTYRPITPDADGPAEFAEFARAMNGLADQRDELLRNYNEDLRRSETRLRGIIESTPVGICITDEQGCYEYVNPTYCRLYGYESGELMGHHFTMVVPESSRDRLTHLHSEFMGRRYELRGEWEVLRRDGSPMSIIADAAYILDVDGRPKKVTFVLDISERKQAERLLHQTVQRLNDEIRRREELEKVKVQVERMIRHDLRNPLNGVIAAAEILMVDELSEEQRELCMIIRESGRKLDSMLSSSMDLIKMEEGTYLLRPQPVNLVAVLQEVRRELEPLAGNSRVGVRFELDGEPLAWGARLPMEGERLYLAQALANVLRNAIEASGEGETVTVRVSSGDPYRIDVHNAGAVPEDVRDVFFDRYATSGKKNGTGLGTYVAALITRIHAGTIAFTTSEEEGTTVTIELPARQPGRG